MSMEHPSNVIVSERQSAAEFTRMAQAAEREGDEFAAREYYACAEIAKQQAERLEQAA